jgi:hypothetical protein
MKKAAMNMHETIKATASEKKVIASHLKRPFRFRSSGLAWVRLRALAANATQPPVHPTQTRKLTPLAAAVTYISAFVISA